ncbi:MAG: phosphoglucosamine mutase [Candidatus Micrarchaeota archaeon]
MLFGTAGIRGIYSKEITEELAFRISNVFADTKQEKLVIARDTRASGINLRNAVVAGSMLKGIKIIDLGIVPTPVLAFATVKHNCNGIMITASHNPEEYNGLKLFANGKEISKAEEAIVEQQYSKNRLNYDETKDYQAHLDSDPDIVQDYLALVKSQVDADAIQKKKFKVLVDCNGAAATVSPYLLTNLGCKVTTLNCELTGFNRKSEPNAENLSDTIKIAKSIGSEITFAHDGDGDRCVVIDEDGEMLPFDVQLAIMIEHELERAKQGTKKVVTTVESSLIVRDAIEKNGGTSIITPVGSVYISEVIYKENACFGGEPCGEYVFANAHTGADGVLAIAKFLEIITKKGKLSELRKKYATYPIAREKFICNDKSLAIKRIEKAIKELKIKGTINQIDGIRIDESDGWFLIRPSGTENIMRLTIEYKTQGRLNERLQMLRDLIKRNL